MFLSLKCKNSKKKIIVHSFFITVLALCGTIAYSTYNPKASTVNEKEIPVVLAEKPTIEQSKIIINNDTPDYDITEVLNFDENSNFNIKYINSNAVVVLSEANDEATVVASLEYSDSVLVKGEDVKESYGWTQIKTAQGVEGYVRTQYLCDDMLFFACDKEIYVNDNCSLRLTPNISDDNIYKNLNVNDVLIVNGYNDDWLKITYENETYYLEAKYLSNNMLFFKEEKTMYSLENCDVFASPYSDTNSLFSITPGEEMQQLSCNTNWAQISYKDSIYFVKLNTISKYKPVTEEKTKKIVAYRNVDCKEELKPVIDYAYVLLNQAVYKYSYATPYKTDCSGLTMQCYQQIGINISRSSWQQATDGVSVDFDDLQPGDILCFSAKGASIVSHVGLYVGDGIMVHASTEKTGIRETTLENYLKYGGNLVTVRRIVE